MRVGQPGSCQKSGILTEFNRKPGGLLSPSRMAEAVALEKDDFDLRMKLAEYLHRLEQFDDAETQLAAAARLAERDEQRAAVLESRVKNDQAAGRLAARIEAMRQELEADPDATAGALDRAGPLPRGRRQAPRGRPRRRPGDRDRRPIDPGLDAGGPGPRVGRQPGRRRRRPATPRRRSTAATAPST